VLKDCGQLKKFLEIGNQKFITKKKKRNRNLDIQDDKCKSKLYIINSTCRDMNALSDGAKIKIKQKKKVCIRE
jgi:hypothetical protein